MFVWESRGSGLQPARSSRRSNRRPVSNFVPDVRGFELRPSRRGFQAVGMMFSMANNQSIAHVSSFPPGVYKWGHCHGVGAHLLILDGIGYSLFWFEGEPRRRVDWQVGSLIS